MFLGGASAWTLPHCPHMDMTTTTLGAVGYSFGYVFSLWPLIVLSPIRWKRENVLAGMIIVWTLMLFGWLLASTVSPRPLVELIPEPFNTHLFFLTGLALLVWSLLREVRRQRLLQAIVTGKQTASQLLDLQGAQFSSMAIDLYRSLGYAARRAGPVGRAGADVLLRGRGDQRWLVRCRGWRGPVEEEAVREFWDEVKRRQADGGILITSGLFSRGAREWAEGKHLSLMEGEEFLQAWRQSGSA